MLNAIFWLFYIDLIFSTSLQKITDPLDNDESGKIEDSPALAEEVPE